MVSELKLQPMMKLLLFSPKVKDLSVWGFLSFLISDPLGLISGPLGLVSDPWGLIPDPLRLKSDPMGLKSDPPYCGILI